MRGVTGGDSNEGKGRKGFMGGSLDQLHSTSASAQYCILLRALHGLLLCTLLNII